LDELIAHANAGRQQLKAAAPMRQSEVFQFELGRIAAELRAARAYHDMQVASHWHHALAGTLKDEALHAQGTQAGAWIATTCVHLTDACFTLAGGTGSCRYTETANNGGYTIERGHLGKTRPYYDIANWAYADLDDTMIFVESIMDACDAPAAVISSSNKGADLDYGPRGPQQWDNLQLRPAIQG
jgi:alkylation response protein AidB-like acyl-CoA dehydrogenase